MPKATTERRNAEATPYTRPVPAALRYTSGRVLHSVYCPKPIAVRAGKGTLTEGSVKGAGKASLPRLRNCNMPKILKTFDVYAKLSSQTIGKASKTTDRRWVNPPYPLYRPKTKNRSEGPCNYATFYVPLDDDGQCSDSNNFNAGNAKAVEAKRRQIYINRWTQLEANQEVLKEEQPPFMKFPCLLPAGERHSLKVETNNDEMIKLIVEMKEIRRQLGIGYDSPLPSAPQFDEEQQPPPLMRSRTRTYFSIYDCPHPKLYEYIRRLPHASTSMTHIPTKQNCSGISAES
ncbi:uncharacterized protein LOC110181557 [Drosophila serrata]|uniref:uncharacterized protein LOC110181557 n=1 Tax=Drosophila serrata TaxID=7274 RepID=UPI000A1D0815|nr:uncharacterized protein LOC110181557 [Drosophila serrata]